ncbi:MAG: hypothetical protein EOP19_01765 [Hyphomicrobiales bacterium]|nr:MAG: hypothetical protein EOP19_01765 [Hyphomicrobiales bacterium]
MSMAVDQSRVEEHEAKLRALRAALAEGERSGTPTEFDFDAFVQRLNAPAGDASA